MSLDSIELITYACKLIGYIWEDKYADYPFVQNRIKNIELRIGKYGYPYLVNIAESEELTLCIPEKFESLSVAKREIFRSVINECALYMFETYLEVEELLEDIDSSVNYKTAVNKVLELTEKRVLSILNQ